MSDTSPDILYENDLYSVSVVQDALDEDNKSRCAGYGISNKTTGVREATHLVWGEARWRADNMYAMVKELDSRAAAAEDAIIVEDVVLN